MAAVTVVMSGDEAALFRSYQKVIDAANKLGAASKGASKESQEASEKAKKEKEAQTKAEREHLKQLEKGRAMVESLRTPQEQYNAKLREAVALKRSGAISVETLQRRYKQLKTDLNAATAAQARASAEIKRSETAMGRFGSAVTMSVGNVASLAAGYIGIQQTIGFVTGAIQDQVNLQKEQLDLVLQVGKAQQDAIKNLTGLTPQQKQEALQSAAEIQQQTGFASREQLVTALGAGFSASGDIEATKDAVAAAAELSRLTPDQVSGVSSGALDIRRGSGVDDAESNLGFLLQAGAFARIEDPALLAKNLAPAVASASGVFKGDQQQVAKDSAALFAAFSRAATDKTGESTSTATIVFNQKLSEFFADLPDKVNKATAEISKLEAAAEVTIREQMAISEAELKVKEIESRISSQGAPRTDEQQLKADRLKLDLEDAKLSLEETRSKATLTDEEKQRLDLLKKQREELGAITAPSTPLEAARLLQQNEGLRTEFTGQDFGEARFKDAFKAVFDETSTVAKEAFATAGELKFSRATFDETVSQLEGLTPEIIIATGKAKSDAASQVESLANMERETIGVVNDMRAKALKDATRPGMVGWYDWAMRGGDALIGSSQATPEDAAKTATGVIRAKITELESYGVTAQEQGIINGLLRQQEIINQTMEELRKAAESLNKAGSKLGQGKPQPAKPVTDAARLQAGLANSGAG